MSTGPRTNTVQALSGVSCRGAGAHWGLAVVCLWLPYRQAPNLTMALYDGAKAVRILQKLLGILSLDLSPGER